MEKIVIKRGLQRRSMRLRRAAPALRGSIAAAAVAIMASSIPPAMVEGPGRAAIRLPSPIQPAPASVAATAAPIVPVLPSADAAALNAAIPFTPGANPAARPFLLRAAALDELRSLDCLTSAIYYEAASESEDGQRAVAQVVLNRMRHPAYPATICGVVHQGPMRAGGGCQFTFTCDGSLARRPAQGGWQRARRIAADALAGRVFAPVGLATHYHADYVVPAWAPRLAKIAAIGTHIFYRWGGAAGTPMAFTQRYAGGEFVPAPRKAAATGISFATSAPSPIATPVADPLPAVRFTDGGLPQSRIRSEYRNSGTWRTDAPAPAPERGL